MKYPIGIQTFQKIRLEGYTYIDKTDLVYELAQRGIYYFLSRPRRFGKSLLLSTLEAYFLGRKELFEGLAIEKLEKDWHAYPVIHIDLNAGPFDSIESLRRHLNAQIASLEKTYGCEPADMLLVDRFRQVIERASQSAGRNVVVLIDEYDKPLIEAIGKSELQEAFRDELRAIYSVLKSQDKYIRFAMLTGVTKFGRLSVFSGLNNLNDITFAPRYATICGITEEEMLRTFHEGISQIADAYSCSDAEMVDRLREMYDGYRFTSANKLVYNPFSLLMAFDHEQLGAYWFETGTPKYLVQLLKRNRIAVNKLEGCEADNMMLSGIDTEGGNPIPIIYQSGYLTIKDYNQRRNRYTLGFPNQEVCQGFMEYLLPFYINSREIGAFDVDRFVDDIENGRVSMTM